MLLEHIYPDIKKISELLIGMGETLSTAESCTGGMLGQYLTSLPGASKWYYGGVISYDNSIKERILSVPKETLIAYGAVSRETVCAMVNGVSELFGSEHSLAVSGIAGPDGGTEEKPIGLVWFAIKNFDKVHAHKKIFAGSREEIRIQATEELINLLLNKINK